ncbi:hypothetical protein A2765_06020 [Candidatus Kaiserbacteria bacterium RIFCSPHIGHO2_01_FULL_56_24]|uniref:Guanylate kinase-like domain-containing protein n=1 Tax=Candidatus Kaiserbacteria bacterium RIFCSPHIGHO2_01_FULL_56_24 TaxID=1798487 RepID=A0A1F6D8D7_9BACT|nr:MAG: hypothetical protein A2765_06020 [Candidatus Kaiserbacteria bacterium RIFCSPHIGHO2_01_FULL_56_24]
MQKQVVVIAGPAGSGKNSVIEGVTAHFRNCSRLVTATTRAPRSGEQHEVDYYFFSEPEFMDALAKGDILEHRDVKSLGTHYGVYKPDLEKRLARGDVVLCHLDIIGVRYLHEHYNSTSFFIMPESLEELENRIRARNQGMSNEEISKRMEIAAREIREDAPQCDYQIVNADNKLDAAVDQVIEILRKEGYTLES